MDLNLKDKHVLITGGSKGIGYACAAAFLVEGARVSLESRSTRPHAIGCRRRRVAALGASASMLRTCSIPSRRQKR